MLFLWRISSLRKDEIWRISSLKKDEIKFCWDYSMMRGRSKKSNPGFLFSTPSITL
jgi:hypothetical protein